MSRALALLLALCALVLPSIARAHGRVDVRVPARASGAVEASARSRVGSPEFLQRDPEGYVDSVNVYAAMANDPINNRDPTGRCVWEGDAVKQRACWSRAKEMHPTPRECAATVGAIVLGEDVELSGINAPCVYAVYSAKEGVTVTDPFQKKDGAGRSWDPLHRRMVRLFALYFLRSEGGDAFEARIAVDGYRHAKRSAESLLGRDLERYFWGRATTLTERFFTTSPIPEVYDTAKYVPWLGELLRADGQPASAAGGGQYTDRGKADRNRASSDVPPFDPPPPSTGLGLGSYSRVEVGARTPRRTEEVRVYPVVGKDADE